MMLYRHIDLKKYVDIKFEKGLLYKTVIIYIFSIVLYYSHNLYLNIFNLVVVCIYSYILNRDFLNSTLNKVIVRFRR